MIRPPEPGKAPALSDRLYLLLARRDVACFRFFLEAQDNLALFSCLGQQEGPGGGLTALSLRFAPGARAQVLAWLSELGGELELTLLAAPPAEPPRQTRREGSCG